MNCCERPNQHLNSTDFFKARAVHERKKQANAMLKDKQTCHWRKKLRQEALEILKKHGEPTIEKIKEYPAPAMKKLYEWKLNKKSTEAREKLLLKAYLEAPTPLKDPEWTMSGEIKLKQQLTDDMCAKDTALGVQLKQTAKAIANNIDDLDDESKAELLQKLQGVQGERSIGDNQSGIM